MLEHDIGMLTTVIIGNSSTFFYDNKIITPRGYQRKYTLGEEKQSLKPHQRLTKEAEPWALNQETGKAHPGYEQIVKKEQEADSLDMALKALSMVTKEETNNPFLVQQHIESIFEFAVSPGVANKFITPEQMSVLAETIGEKGTLEYTPDHRFLVKVSTDHPERIVEKIEQAQFMVMPIGDVVNVKACDFCDGEKADSIPVAEEIAEKFGGLKLPKRITYWI